MEHSAKYEIVSEYYARGLWSKAQVSKAVGKWITAAEYEEITGEVYAQ